MELVQKQKVPLMVSPKKPHFLEMVRVRGHLEPLADVESTSCFSIPMIVVLSTDVNWMIVEYFSCLIYQ